MIYADYHIHTLYSQDSVMDPRKAVDKAVSLGLKEIAVTDHLDFSFNTMTPYVDINLDDYTTEILALKEEYAGRVTIKLGLEIGLTPEIAERVKHITDLYPFDFIISSSHDIKGAGLFDGSFFVGKTKLQAYEEYFKEVLAVVKACPDYCVYGHLDYIERYGRCYSDPAVYYNDYRETIDKLLAEIISQGKGIEVNTSGYRYGLGHASPQPDIIRRYKELGGELITIGSDAHRFEHIAMDFDKAEDMLKSFGYKYFALYNAKKPVMVKI